ncbi:MAG TPA: hypothetical protein DCX54_00290 [Flavobacteriales bacterium]|nr:hypothetical protein [Flavobacteriales bacterium]
MPTEETELLSILSANGFEDIEMTRAACQALIKLRAMDLTKKPGLSELVDWVGYAKYKELTPKEIDEMWYSEVLLKNRKDQQRVKQHKAESSKK